MRKKVYDKIQAPKRSDIFDEFMTPFDRLFDEFFSKNNIFHAEYPDFFKKGSYPKVDILNKKDRVVIEAAVPGMSKEDISVEVLNGTLTISGEKSTIQEDSSEYICKELKRSNFRRSWTLRDDLDSENVSAKFENGMLYLEIPKLMPDKAKDVPLKIDIS